MWFIPLELTVTKSLLVQAAQEDTTTTTTTTTKLQENAAI